MTFKETMVAIFATAEGTYYKWKKQQRPIVLLVEKYFTKEELEEFLETGEITSFSKIHSPVALRVEKLEQKQREQDEIILQLKNELKRLRLKLDGKKLHYDKAGNPIPSGKPRK